MPAAVPTFMPSLPTSVPSLPTFMPTAASTSMPAVAFTFIPAAASTSMPAVAFTFIPAAASTSTPAAVFRFIGYAPALGAAPNETVYSHSPDAQGCSRPTGGDSTSRDHAPARPSPRYICPLR
jgi:hypothetical protein